MGMLSEFLSQSSLKSEDSKAFSHLLTVITVSLSGPMASQGILAGAHNGVSAGLLRVQTGPPPHVWGSLGVFLSAPFLAADNNL